MYFDNYFAQTFNLCKYNKIVFINLGLVLGTFSIFLPFILLFEKMFKEK